MVGVAAVIALLSITAGIGCLGAAVIARHRAQAAADLAAVAAAAKLSAGADAACAQAARIATAMDTVVIACAVDGLDVVLTVGATVAVGAWDVGPARARARAGPIGSRGPDPAG